jgi:Na+/H+-dicarboxylate symporter/ABC-type amino acid transport substrate-binding protein
VTAVDAGRRDDVSLTTAWPDGHAVRVDSNRILLGLGAGVAVGLFLGEYAVALKWAADGFVKLLQMTVLPYVTLSIVTSLGSLTYSDARTLGLRAGAVVVTLWGIAILFACLMPLTFPHIESATFFSTTLVERPPPFDFVDLYIPSNPFNSLANNVVPAVVLFSVIVGVALIGVERKQGLLDVLRTATQAVSRATQFIVRLTPYGLFAIAAVAAGTLGVEQLGRLQVYLITYVAVALLLSFWVLPGLVAAVTPIRVHEIFGLTRNALITAFVAGDLFIVLPSLIDASRTLIARHSTSGGSESDLPEVLVPASFNFPHTGKLLSISFILFAGWFADAVVPLAQYPKLALTGLLTFFGSLNSAVPFLLDLFRIPSDTFQLFLATGVINSRVGTLVAAVHTLTVALLGTCAIAGMVRVDRGRLVRYLVITALLTVAVIGGARLAFATWLRPVYASGEVLASMRLLHETVPAVVHTSAPLRGPAETRPILEVIRERGILRVGFMRDAMPFSYLNARGELVGLDVELAHQLARELRARLEFIPIDRATLIEQVTNDDCDIVMAGVTVTTLRAAGALFSNSYLDETFAFVVPDYARDDFSSWSRIREHPSLTIAMPDVPYYVDKIREMLPRAKLHLVPDIALAFSAWPPDVDAVAIPAERGSAWTLLYPQFSVVVPEPGIIKVPLGYPVSRRDEAFASFINTWIDLKRKDGTLDALYSYWVLGHDAAPTRPRWSIMRNLLHWVD